MVHGRPVHFVDDDAEAADAQGGHPGRDRARQSAFDEVSFQYEPIAAALDYERQIAREEIALIADIGGGTSDFSIVRLGPERRGRPDRAAISWPMTACASAAPISTGCCRSAVMPHLGYPAADEARRAGGADGYFPDLSTWAKINFLYTPQVRAELVQVQRELARPELIDRLIAVVEHQLGHRLAMTVERAKIKLSESSAIRVPLDWIEPGLAAVIARSRFDQATAELAGEIGAMLRKCLRRCRASGLGDRCRVPDRRLDPARQCPPGDPRGAARGARGRRRQIRLGRQGPHARSAAALWAEGVNDALVQIASGTIWMAPHGHSWAQMPQPLQ